ncbi:dihydrofolate reductase family protein [Flammeovirga pacifica]|uniref:Bacterial bifunctional deaminase-reductase C-terminal domain-containing protein n=1 Tax=Flammeovirga pacifica TaxID=915059 RepID=A0A1S1YVT4_FLAPC|nr:dihydrofolate reductase family protein [Flammeovirga pacifica]OHX65144.1 hypothetical protein NH26_01630 [Flammeovirga pacifica]
MRKIITYIAMSIDGKIADAKGGVQWLDEFTHNDENYGYDEFYKSIDTTIMGNTTYQHIKNMGVDFPYKGKINYVITKNRDKLKEDHIDFISEDVMGTVRSLKNFPSDKDIWLIGGGKINSLLQDNGLIDEMRLFIAPVVLGNGVPLFSPFGKISKFKLISSKQYASGMVEMRYKKLEV